jgi:signal transduction histidine kinase
MLKSALERRTTTIPDTSPIRIDFSENWGNETMPLHSRSKRWPQQISRIGWLSASMVHDLRNPLGTVVAGAEMLVQLELESTQVKRLATNIYRAAGRMRELLADLAAASRGNGPTSVICKIRDVINAVSEAASPAAERQSVRIVNDVPGSIEIPLDRSRIESVFFNLITNALEAMPHGGTIRMGARKADHCVLIEVEDTGPGIPLAIRDRLFEPFVTSGKDHGMGLGLTLSRQTVLDHGGDMWIERAAGARFVVRLPLQQNEDLPQGASL